MQFVAVVLLSGDTEVPLKPVSLTQVTMLVDMDPSSGELRRVESTTVRGERAMFEEAGLTGPAISAQIRLPNGTEWAVDPSTSIWGPVMVTLGLSRKLLVRKHEARRANI